MPIPESFQTRFVRAERLSPGHFDDLLELHQNPRTMVELGGVRDEDETSRYLARNLDHWAEHGFGVWMLREAEGDRSMGRIVLRWLSTDRVDDVEIGFALLPDFWGLGIATEAARFCLGLARIELGLKTLVGVTTPGNHASQRVLRKLMLRHESEVTINGTECLLYRIRWPATEQHDVDASAEGLPADLSVRGVPRAATEEDP
jgi:ribosomal-protein-alanine N-acetyltransferase